MASISKENSFSLKGSLNLRGIQLINRLKMVSKKIRRLIIERNLLLELNGEESPETLGEFLNYHSEIKKINNVAYVDFL